MEVHQHHVQRGLQAAVLEGIVQDDAGGFGGELLAAVHAVFVHGDGYLRELVGNLHGFVAVEGGGAVGRKQLEAFELAFVAAREHGGLLTGGEEQPQKQLHMRRFARAANGDVAHANGGDRGGKTFFPAFVVQQMPYSEYQPVNHGRKDSKSSPKSVTDRTPLPRRGLRRPNARPRSPGWP